MTEFKTLPPDTSIDGDALLFGADSQAAATPSIYSMSTIISYILDTHIGTDVQAWDAQLDSLSGASADGVSLTTAADYAAMRALLDLEPGVDFLSLSALAAAYQPLDAELTSLSGASADGVSLVTAADYAAMLALLNVEDGADVTDAANVTAAGALMDSEVANLADVKAFDTSDYATAAQGATADSAQQPPSEGAFVDGDKTKLDDILTAAEAIADSAGSYTYASELEGEDGTLIDFVGKRVVTFSNENAAKNTITPMATFLTTATRASDGTYVDKDGILQTATTNELRYTHDPFTGQPLGILREEASENLYIKSEDLTDSGWVKTRASISANAAVAPDGTTTMDKLVEDTATGSHQFKRTLTTGIDATLPVAGSFWVKAGERTKLWVLLCGDTTSDRCDVDVDLATGTFTTSVDVVGEATNASGTIEKWLDGLYRIKIVCTPNTTPGTKAFLDIRLHDGASASYTGDGTSGAYFWGIQLEQASEASSYMATGAATVSRAGDTIEGDLSKLDQQGGPVSIAVVGRYNSVTTSANQYIFSMDDTIATDSFLIYRVAAGGLRVASYSGSSLSTNLSLGTMTDASPDLVLVVTFQENSMRGKSSLGVADAETGDSLPVGDMTRMQFGRGGAGANCTIERVVISNRGWSDTKIARIAASRD